MKCFAQFFYGPGYASPFPDDYEVFDSIIAVEDTFRARCLDPRFPCIDSTQATAFIFCGIPEGLYPCDTTPDYTLRFGPRGGIRRDRV